MTEIMLSHSAYVTSRPLKAGSYRDPQSKGHTSVHVPGDVQVKLLWAGREWLSTAYNKQLPFFPLKWSSGHRFIFFILF